MQDGKSTIPVRGRVHDLYAEIRQIYQQYLKAVPKKNEGRGPRALNPEL